jgi:hypothetical protein
MNAAAAQLEIAIHLAEGIAQVWAYQIELQKPPTASTTSQIGLKKPPTHSITSPLRLA